MNTKNEAPKHTPGPWEASYDSYGGEIWFGGEGWGTWTVGPAYIGGQGDTGPGREEMDADARLISAAPEMLEACKAVVQSGMRNAAYDLCVEAIAKATGKAMIDAVFEE